MSAILCFIKRSSVLYSIVQSLLSVFCLTQLISNYTCTKLVETFHITQLAFPLKCTIQNIPNSMYQADNIQHLEPDVKQCPSQCFSDLIINLLSLLHYYCLYQRSCCLCQLFSNFLFAFVCSTFFYAHFFCQSIGRVFKYICTQGRHLGWATVGSCPPQANFLPLQNLLPSLKSGSTNKY